MVMSSGISLRFARIFVMVVAIFATACGKSKDAAMEDGTGAVHPQDDVRLRLSSTFRCEFPIGVSGNLQRDSPSSTVFREKFSLVFDNVSVPNGTARMIGNNGGSDIVVSGADEGITLLEPLESGFFQMTVIYAAHNSSGSFKAVHSRHSSLMGWPLPSQYYGSCSAFR